MNQLELEYQKKTAWQFLLILGLHLPVMLLAAYSFETSMLLAAVATLFLLVGPVLVTAFAPRSRLLPAVFAVATMGCSALLIHLGRGMIEMHFHIFVFLGALVMFGSISGVATAVVTVALHHVLFYFWLPQSLFNYEASFGIVILHATFVLVEAVPMLMLARWIRQSLREKGTTVVELDHASEWTLRHIGALQQAARDMELNNSSQASGVQESAAAIQQIRSMLQQSEAKVRHAGDTCQQVVSRSKDGDASMQRMRHDFADISRSVEDLERIRKVIESISTKTDIINDIVFKTQLLSFNASIEAARAGREGRGFAVVASEVSKLAQMSGEAAKSITDLLSESRSTVDELVGTIQKRVDQGHQSTQTASEHFNAINSSLGELKAHMDAIEQANTEQNKGLNEVSAAVEQLSGVSLASNHKAKEVAESTAAINEQANTLKNIVDLLTGRSQNKTPVAATSARHSGVKKPDPSARNTPHHRGGTGSVRSELRLVSQAGADVAVDPDLKAIENLSLDDLATSLVKKFKDAASH